MGSSVGIAVGLAGPVLMIFGIVYGAAFLIARRVLDRSLKSEVANSSREYVENVMEQIRNQWVRRIVNRHMGAAAGAVAV
jgi:hypothetical protein